VALPFQQTSLLGLDIGKDSIKIVESNFDKGSFEIVTYGISKHNANLRGYWDGKTLREIATTVEKILESGGFSATRTAMAIASTDVYVTIMDFDAKQDKRDIQAEINRQAKYFLPYPPDEMRMSWGVLDDHQNLAKYTGKQRVVINAIPDFVIENNKHLLEHINLDGVALENQTLSQIRSVLQPDVGYTILADIGHKQTTFSIVSDGELRSSSHINEGSFQITESLGNMLGIEEPIAEYFKKDISLVNLINLPQPLENYLKILQQELTTFYELNRRIAQEARKIVLTGGSVYLAGIQNFLKSMPVPVYIGNPLRTPKIKPEMRPYIQPEANQLSSAIGLSIRRDLI
jgi:type IV pilus assembly protein PilM